jgi:hypothetical protein
MKKLLLIVMALVAVRSTAVPTSQPVNIKDSSSLNKLSNNLNNVAITIAPGSYTFAPKNINGTNISIQGSVGKDSNGHRLLLTNLVLNSTDRWAYNIGKADNVEIKNINFIFHDNTGGLLKSSPGIKFGRVRLVECSQNQANTFWLFGGKDFYCKDCQNLGTAKKYIACNFTDQLDNLVIDQSNVTTAWKQGKEEACVRIMQVYNGYFKFLNILGSNFKQAVQDRPAGKRGTVYNLHLWEDCNITGGLDLGNFKDTSDVNFPFGQLKESKWVRCSIDYFNTTAQGANSIGKAMGILKINFIDCNKGKLNKTIFN